MSESSPALEISELTKVYAAPEVLANDSISFIAQRGDAFGLLGPNGAGKSTLVKQIVGLIRPTAGNVKVLGEVSEPGATLRTSSLIAYLPQTPLGLDDLRVEEAIRYTAMLRGFPEDAARGQAGELVGRLALEELRARPLRKLSGGQRRLTHIAMTLAASLPVLILDEPTADVDPALRQQVWDLLDERRQQGVTVLLVTHDVAEAERVLDQVAIIDGGKIVAKGSPAELKARLSHRVRLEVLLAQGSSHDVVGLQSDLGGEVHVSGRRLSTWVPADEAVRRLEKIMSSASENTFEDIRLVTPSLEDVYLDIVGHSMDEDG